MAGRGIDTINELSQAHLDQLASLGYTTVVRYGSSPGGMDKDIKQPEFDRIVHHPTISLCTNWEDSGAEYEGGFVAGQTLGRRARSFFRTLGWPDDKPIYFSSEGTASSPMTAAKLPLLIAYHQGINSVSPRGIEGMYGPGWAGAELLARGLISHYWQWKGGTVIPGAHVKQLYGSDARLAYSHDLNDLRVADHGQWNATGHQEDSDLTDAQDKILNAILQKVLSMPADVWANPVHDWAANADQPAANMLGFAHYEAFGAKESANAANAKLSGLTLDPPDVVALRQIVREEVDAALADLTLRTAPPS